METLGLRVHPILPIFYLAQKSRCVFYTPGYIAVVTPRDGKELLYTIANNISSSNIKVLKLAIKIQQYAKIAIKRWHQLLKAPFSPECLMVYLSNQCNMSCNYCYVTSSAIGHRQRTRSMPIIDEEVVRSAAHLVANYCAEKNLPLRVVIHGGGEPTLHWALVKRLQAITRLVAEKHKIDWWGYIATNGILSQTQVHWLIEHFNLIGLSCDGPPEIHDRQRPLANGEPSSYFIERTAQILASKGKHFITRATITPSFIERQCEIATYLIEKLGASKIRFEPLYRVRGKGSEEFILTDANSFANHFLKAQQEATKYECQLSFSGVRLNEVHSSYCDVLRNVLHLIPDGTATSCFFSINSQPENGHSFSIAQYDKNRCEFVIDQEAITAHKQQAGRIPERCHDCINVYHCARECPELCMVLPPISKHNQTSGFRCLINRQLAEAWILQAAEQCSRSQLDSESYKFVKVSFRHE